MAIFYFGFWEESIETFICDGFADLSEDGGILRFFEGGHVVFLENIKFILYGIDFIFVEDFSGAHFGGPFVGEFFM